MTFTQAVQLSTSLVATLTLLAIYLQARAMLRANRVQLEVSLHRLYQENCLSIAPETIRAMLIHCWDHFDKEVFLDRYEGDDSRIASYLLMKQKYIAIEFSIELDRSRGRGSTFESVWVPWLSELARTVEFQDVHDRHKLHYPEFANTLSRLGIKTGPKVAREWACDNPGSSLETES